jgi:spore coat protein A, manganese oxidase
MDAKENVNVMLLNGRRWDGPITIRPKLGSTEVWQLVNPTPDAHPIHLHLVRFQVLDRQRFAAPAYLKSWGAERPGEGPDPIAVERYLRGSRHAPARAERGWKDTVIAYPGQVTRIIARFDRHTGKYPWHCHMLEHEDNEMMLQFEVIE